MPGRLAKATISTSQEALVYVNYSDTPNTVNITICSRYARISRFTLAIIEGIEIPDLNVADYLFFNKELDAYDSMEKTGFVIGKNQSIYVKADEGVMSVNVSGF
jgi:hypothetical protein